ncbi:isochorismatase [Vibrio azureus]|nr:isochorismatase [Vibrio azureus]
MITEEQKQNVLTAVTKASKGWRDAFNSGDAKKAASFYEQDAVTTSIPFGIYIGQTAAEGLWDYIISNGYKDVKYFDTKIEVISSNAAVLSGSWEMNKAYGIMTKEIWVVGQDGTAKLRVDDFEVVGAK